MLLALTGSDQGTPEPLSMTPGELCEVVDSSYKPGAEYRMSQSSPTGANLLTLGEFNNTVFLLYSHHGRGFACGIDGAPMPIPNSPKFFTNTWKVTISTGNPMSPIQDLFVVLAKHAFPFPRQN